MISAIERPPHHAASAEGHSPAPCPRNLGNQATSVEPAKDPADLRLRLDRFAPYFCDPQSYPVINLRPEASYSHAYPKGSDLRSLARFFEGKTDGTLPHANVYRCAS